MTKAPVRARYDASLMPDRRSVSWGRLAAVAPVILGSGVLLVLGASVLAFAPRFRRRYRERLFRATCRCLLALLRATVRVVGSPPRPPFLLATNHLERPGDKWRLRGLRKTQALQHHRNPTLGQAPDVP